MLPCKWTVITIEHHKKTNKRAEKKFFFFVKGLFILRCHLSNTFTSVQESHWNPFHSFTPTSTLPPCFAHSHRVGELAFPSPTVRVSSLAIKSGAHGKMRYKVCLQKQRTSFVRKKVFFNHHNYITTPYMGLLTHFVMKTCEATLWLHKKGQECRVRGVKIATGNSASLGLFTFVVTKPFWAHFGGSTACSQLRPCVPKCSPKSFVMIRFQLPALFTNTCTHTAMSHKGLSMSSNLISAGLLKIL